MVHRPVERCLILVSRETRIYFPSASMATDCTELKHRHWQDREAQIIGPDPVVHGEMWLSIFEKQFGT